MSLNQIKDPILGARQNIFCKSCTCSEAKIAEKLEVRDLYFDAVNGDKIELSSVADQGTFGAVLKSNGDGTLQWGTDLVGGVNYTGTLPTAINQLSLYNSTDGTAIKNSSLVEQDLLDTQAQANTNESNITNLQNDKLNIDGSSIMTGNLQMGFNSLTSVNNITAIGTIAGNLNANSLQGLLPGTDIPVNTNLNFLSISDIKNLNNLQTQSISSTDGVSINIQDDINMGLYDINNCNDIKINALTTNTAPNIVSNNNIDMNTNDLLDVGNMNVSTINNITPVGGLYSGISDGVVINQASGQTDLLPVSFVGSLSIPANGFQVGDAFHLVVAGIFPTESNTDDITIEIKQNGTTIASINLELENFDTLPSNFELEMDFIIRSTGTSGSVATNLDFSFNKRVSKDFRGTRSTDITTINTTTATTLSVLATVNGAGSSIQSRLAYLRKQY